MTSRRPAPRIMRPFMWKKVFYALSLLAGLGLGIFVIGQFGGFAKALEVIGDVGWTGLAVYVANASLTLVAPGIGWYILMRDEGLGVSLRTTLKANLMGFPLNFFTPSMYLGSEPFKTYYLAAAHGAKKRRIIATIIVAKFQEMGGHLLVMLVAAGVSLWRLEFTRRQEIFLIGSMILLTAVFGLMLYAFIGNFKPTVKAINLLAGLRIMRRRLARLRTRAEEMEHLIHQAFTRRWKTFLAAQAVTAVSALSILIRPLLFFGFARERPPLHIEHLCAIFLITNVINTLPLTPGGLGVFEAGMVGFFAATGIGRENAAAFSLVGRTSDLCLILVGMWLIVHTGMQAIARRVAKGEERVRIEDARDEGWQPPA